MFLLACSVLISFLNCLQETHFRSTNSLMNIWQVASCTMCAAVVWSEAGWSGLCQDVTAQTHHGWKLCSCCWLVKLLFCICFTALPYLTVQFVSVMLVKCFTVLHLVLNCFPSASQWGWLKLKFNSLNTSDVTEYSRNKTTLKHLHSALCTVWTASPLWLLGFLAFGIWSCDLMSSFCHHLCVASSPPELHRSAAHLPNSNGSSVVSLRNNTADISLFKSQRISLKGPFIPKI